MMINDVIIKQVDGLPMGGLLSAPPSCIDAMYREEKGKKPGASYIERKNISYLTALLRPNSSMQ